jgi:chromate reductase
MPKLLGLSGSLRAGSYNTALLRAAAGLMPPGATLEIATPHGIPLYGGDLEAREGIPPAVQALKERIVAADGLLLATPEYNNGMPGVLKNAIDWLSRPPRGSALNGKVAAVMGASPGMTGTARSESQLRQPFVFTNTYALLQPEVLVARAHEKFDADGRLVDQPTRDFLATFLQRFAEYIGRFTT